MESIHLVVPHVLRGRVEPPYPRIRYPRIYRGPKILTHSLPKSTMVDLSIYVLIYQRRF
jgi:hypothetical protein